MMAAFLSNRSDLIKHIELDQLKFHSVAHGLYATARLIEVLLHEQRTHNLIAHRTLGSLLGDEPTVRNGPSFVGDVASD